VLSRPLTLKVDPSFHLFGLAIGLISTVLPLGIAGTGVDVGIGMELFDAIDPPDRTEDAI
jgi:hypothetical protein